MAEFATPVAMKVTEKQFTRDLEKPLKALGYIKRGKILREVYLVTQDCAINNEISFYSDRELFSKRYIIEEYNPELFLAIAAMTEDKIPIIGEWLIYKGLRGVNSIFRVKEYGKCNDYAIGRINKENPNGSGCFLKASLEELTNHFSKPKETFVLPKVWKLRVTEENVNAVNRWKSFKGYPTIVVPHDFVNQSGMWENMSMVSAFGFITTEQFMEHVYKPAFNKEIPDEFYVKYCEGFTEDIFNELRLWSEENGDIGGESEEYIGYAEFIRQDRIRYFLFEKDCPNDYWSFGIDDHIWDEVKTEYTLEQVKELINYKSKTNKNECKEEDSYGRESSYDSEKREIKQIDGDLDSISSRAGGKEIKIRTVSSRNLCERGSIESSNSITSPRGSSNRLRAERGRLYI